MFLWVGLAHEKFARADKYRWIEQKNGDKVMEEGIRKTQNSMEGASRNEEARKEVAGVTDIKFVDALSLIERICLSLAIGGAWGGFLRRYLEGQTLEGIVWQELLGPSS